MLFEHYSPGPPLDAFVECFWFYEDAAPQAHRQERVLPTGTADIVINLQEDRFDLPGPDGMPADHCRGILVSGPQSRFFVIDTAEKAAVCGVHFRPGGAAPFLGPPAGDFTDRHVPLDAVWGSLAAELRERLLEARNLPSRCAAIEDVLLRRAGDRLVRPAGIDRALRRLRHDPVLPCIGDLAAELGMSHRHFIAQFAATVGLTPKLYGRIRRFQLALAQFGTGAQPAFADLAAACGYYDQAHFIRDFSAFAGLTPSAYAARRIGDEPNHLIHDA